MGKVFSIVVREVRSYLQDKTDLAFSLLLPVAIFALMYGAYSGYDVFNGTAYIVNHDTDGSHALRLIERLRQQEGLEVTLLSLEDADARLQASDILVVAIVPEDFSERLDSGWPTTITFRQRGNGGMEGQIVAAMVRSEADAIGREIQIERQVTVALAGKEIAGEQVRTTVQGLLERERLSPTVRVVESTIGGAFNLVHLFMPGIMSMFILFAITLGSRALVEERKKGTLERLLTTQLSVGQLYAGKLIAMVGRGFVQVLILLTLAGLVFQLFTPLSFFNMLLVSLVFVTAGSTLALVIASVSRTEDQAMSISVLFTMATVLLGGAFFPIPPDSVLHVISKASINTYINTAYKTLMSGDGALNGVTLELIVLTGTVIVGLVLSRSLFRVVAGGR
jgi:ABC-2 type transport system permease protein